MASGRPVGEGLEKLSLSGPLACTLLGLSTLGNCRKDWASLCLNEMLWEVVGPSGCYGDAGGGRGGDAEFGLCV